MTLFDAVDKLYRGFTRLSEMLHKVGFCVEVELSCGTTLLLAPRLLDWIAKSRGGSILRNPVNQGGQPS